MKKIKTNLLAFEVTRRCNQNCAHCCKGKSQSIDMSTEIVDELFRNKEFRITEIKHFSITGGEPTLVPNFIEYLIDTIIELNVLITNHIIFLTNGLIYDEKIINSINKLMSYLKGKKECQEVQLLFELSNDQFHIRPDKEVLDKYAALPFLNKKFLSPRIVDDIMNEGNAKDNGIGGKRTYKDYLEEMDVKILNDEVNIDNGLLITANGNVVNVGCTSYVEEDKIALDNLNETSFLTIVEKYKKQ